MPQNDLQPATHTSSSTNDPLSRCGVPWECFFPPHVTSRHLTSPGAYCCTSVLSYVIRCVDYLQSLSMDTTNPARVPPRLFDVRCSQGEYGLFACRHRRRAGWARWCACRDGPSPRRERWKRLMLPVRTRWVVRIVALRYSSIGVGKPSLSLSIPSGHCLRREIPSTRGNDTLFSTQKRHQFSGSPCLALTSTPASLLSDNRLPRPRLCPTPSTVHCQQCSHRWAAVTRAIRLYHESVFRRLLLPPRRRLGPR